jgi:hypothetical protein
MGLLIKQIVRIGKNNKDSFFSLHIFFNFATSKIKLYLNMKKALLLFAILFGISFLGFAQENFSINLGYRF